MAREQIVKAAVAVSVAGLIVIAGMHLGSVKVLADEKDSGENLVAIGLRIAPDFINKQGKDPDLLGLGSFIVNAQIDCNGCHGSDPANEFLPKNNPYFLPPNKYPIRYNRPAT